MLLFVTTSWFPLEAAGNGWKQLEVLESKQLSFRLTEGGVRAWPIVRELSQLACGEYYLSWYVGSDKHLEPVGSDLEAALNALELKRLEMAFVAAGGQVKQPDIKKELESAYLLAVGSTEKTEEVAAEKAPRKLVSETVAAYLSNCEERGGKSGYGLSLRTHEAYEYRLGFLTEFDPNACIDQIDAKFLERFRSFLLKHEKDLSDRTSYNIMQAVSTFLIRNGSAVAKPFLKEMKFPPTEVIAYSNDEMQKFFAVCDEEEELSGVNLSFRSTTTKIPDCR